MQGIGLEMARAAHVSFEDCGGQLPQVMHRAKVTLHPSIPDPGTQFNLEAPDEQVYSPFAARREINTAYMYGKFNFAITQSLDCSTNQKWRDFDTM